jgi:hypothetical protein
MEERRGEMKRERERERERERQLVKLLYFNTLINKLKLSLIC